MYMTHKCGQPLWRDMEIMGTVEIHKGINMDIKEPGGTGLMEQWVN